MPQKVYETFFKEGEVVEIRAIGVIGKSKAWEGYARKNDVVAGYFDNAKSFADAALALDKAKAKGVYFTINPCKPALLARASNRLIASPKATTTDKDIKCLRWLPIDLDPERPSEISATNEEVEEAKKLAKIITDYLEGKDHQFPKGIRAFSGNGYHITYHLPDLPNDEEHQLLIKKAIKAIESIFSNDKVNIDLKVVNPARIWKAYGTTGRKGDSTEERPHRKSYLFPEQPIGLDKYPNLSLEQLRKLAALAPEDERFPYPPALPPGKKKTGQTSRMESGLGTLDVGEYLEHYGRAYKIKAKETDTFYCLDECVFDPNHRKGESAIVSSPSPPFLTYQCFHNSCTGKTWQEARAVISGSDSLAPFCANYDPKWKAPSQMGTGILKDIKVQGIELVQEHESLVPLPHKIDPSEFYEKRGKRAAFAPSLMAKYFAAYLRHIVHTDGIFWRYEKGVWTRFSKYLLAQICALCLKDQIQASYIENSLKVFAATVNREEYQWPQYRNLINCPNGMVDLKTGKLIAHDPKYGSRTQIQAKFDYEAQYDRWQQYLKEVFPEDLKRKPNEIGKAEVLQQFFGYCMLSDCRFEKAMFLYGGGANGKSTALGSLIEILGRNNVSSLTITDLGQRFKTQFLSEKLVNIATETNTRDPIASEIFKAAIRGEPITAEKKYGEPYLFEPFAKWLVAMNTAPVVPDKTYGFTRGIIVLEFKRRFEGEEIDPYLREKLVKERDGIFMWALFGLEKLLQKGRFDIPGIVEEETDDFMKTMNPMRIFIDEVCVIDKDATVGSVHLYDEYKKWCSDGGNRPLSRNKFYHEVEANCPTVRVDRFYEGENRRRGFIGLGVRD